MYLLKTLASDLRKGKITSRQLVEDCLARIDDSSGEGQRAVLKVYREQALSQADGVDLARQRGWSTPEFAGIPMTIKDLFDHAGEITRAGSHALDNQNPAATDAPIVSALKAAGFIIVGKTNMTEFAFSGLGMNAHYGTPLSPWDRDVGHIPGGSSSGGAVSVSDAMAAATIGTDTGGSCRIPAAFCGITGFKPTASRVPTEGATPLSTSLDSIGPLANSVSCCAILDSVISGDSLHGADVSPIAASGLRFGVIENFVNHALDSKVAQDYQAVLERLAAAGVSLQPVTLAELDELPVVNSNGGLVGAEALAWHTPYLETRKEYYDPWVHSRIVSSTGQLASDYISVLNHRSRIQNQVRAQCAAYDAMVLPTVQIVPPDIASLADYEHSIQVNQLCLRNTAVGNFLNHPSISLPSHAPGTAPTGFMLMGVCEHSDHQLLAVAAGVESIVRDTQ